MTKAIAEANELVQQIAPLLKGRGGHVQGMVLADLVATYFAGHNPSVRGAVMAAWIVTMRTLIPVNEQAIMPGGWPHNNTVQ